MAYFSYDDYVLCFYNEAGDPIPVSVKHDTFLSPEGEEILCNGTVLFEAKDIKSWAKKKNIVYPAAINHFVPVFYGDNGKEFFVRK